MAPGTGRPVCMSVTWPWNAPVQIGSRPKLTVTLLEVVFVMPPPLALMFSVKVPNCAFVAALRLRMEVPGGISVGGENCAVTPDGRTPTALSLIHISEPTRLG